MGSSPSFSSFVYFSSVSYVILSFVVITFVGIKFRECCVAGMKMPAEYKEWQCRINCYQGAQREVTVEIIAMYGQL